MLPDGVRRFFRLERGPRGVAADVEAELRDHFERKVAALVAAGLAADAAREEALRQFGDLARTREALMSLDTDRVRTGALADRVDGWWQDTRLAVRSLARAPGLTAAVVVMLGLGIGAAAAMYGLLDRLLLRTGPHVTAPDELRRIYVHEFDRRSQARRFRGYFSADEVADLRRALPGSPALAVATSMRSEVDEDESDLVPVMYVSGDAFGVLGVRPLRGRLLEPADDLPGAAPAAVISEAFWRTRFGASPDLVDRTVRLSGVVYSIVGVAPAGFSWLQPDRADIWVPMNAGLEARFAGWDWRRGNITLEAVVRVPAGAAVEPLAQAVERAYRARVAAAGRGDSSAVAHLGPVAPGRRPGGATTRMRLSLIVAGVAALLCAIAVANATNLLILRAVQRRRDTAIRLALGAGRGRLLRAVIVESVLLALLAAGVATAVSGWGGELLRTLIVRAEWQAPLMSARVALFALLSALVLGIVTGLLPGWHAGRSDAVAVLKSGVRGDRGRHRTRQMLVAFQAACTVMLVAGLGLYGRSFARAAATDYGVAVDRIVIASLSGPRDIRSDTTGRMAAITAAVAERVAGLPGVEMVTRVNLAPIWGYSWGRLVLEGVDSVSVGDNGPFLTESDHVFFEVAGIRLLRGRTFAPGEIAPASPVVVVNRALAERFWPGQDPLGKCVRVGGEGERDRGLCRRIIGVVENYRRRLHEEAPHQVAYVPLGFRWHSGAGGHTVMARTARHPAGLVASVQRIVKELAPETNISSVTALGDIPAREREPWVAGIKLFGIFAALALILAAGGLYSVVAHTVAQRRPEFGVRIALGARTIHLARLVLTAALRPAAVGVVIGLGATLWLVKYLAPLLFETSPRDPVALVVAAGALLVVAGLAALVPAREAARTNPREALQAE